MRGHYPVFFAQTECFECQRSSLLHLGLLFSRPLLLHHSEVVQLLTRLLVDRLPRLAHQPQLLTVRLKFFRLFFENAAQEAQFCGFRGSQEDDESDDVEH